jgi:hypothetical protein
MQAIEDKIRQHLKYLETLQAAAQQAQAVGEMPGAGGGAKGGVTTPNRVRVKPSTEAMTDTQRSAFNGAA